MVQYITECYWHEKSPELNKKQIYVKTPEQKL